MRQLIIILLFLFSSSFVVFAQESDWPTDIASLRQEAEKGNAEAQDKLGFCYLAGHADRGNSTDMAEALKWFQKAAEQGDAMGQNNFASMFEEGKGVPQDYNEAIKWYQKSADQGFESAKQSLAELKAKQANH